MRACVSENTNNEPPCGRLLNFITPFVPVCNQYRTYYNEVPCAFKPCPLEKNSNGGFKREHVEPCTSTTMLYLILGAPTNNVT